MQKYELRFAIDQPSEEVEDALLDSIEGLVTLHEGFATVAMGAQGISFEGAVGSAVEELLGLGVEPLELLVDLVPRTEIAQRAGVTRQAVALWTSGARRRGHFPRPYTDASGGLWLWEEVAPALREMGMTVDDGYSFPTRAELLRACAQVAERAGLRTQLVAAG